MMAGWRDGYEERDQQTGVVDVFSKMVGLVCVSVLNEMRILKFMGVLSVTGGLT